MFHYVRSFDKKFPNFKFCNINSFEKFIKKNKKKIINQELNPKKDKKKILLTFDDGLKDHFTVAKLLHKFNLTGVFFIPSLPYTNNQLLNVHLAHLILGKVNSKVAYYDLINKINNKNILNQKEKKKFSTRYSQQTDNSFTKKFKKTINYYSETKKINKILKFLIKKYKIKMSNKNFYLTINEIKKMNKMGMIIGCHSHSHIPLSRLTKKKQLNEIKKNYHFIKKIIKKDPRHFCFPYGRKNSYNKKTLAILKKLKFSFAHSIENREAFSKKNEKYLELPRYDCNIFIK